MEEYSRIKEILDRLEGIEIRESKNYSFKFPLYVDKEFEQASIDVLELSERARNCLKRAGILTMKDFCNRISKRSDLRELRNCGVKCANEIMDHLFAYQYYRLKPERREEYLAKVIELNAKVIS